MTQCVLVYIMLANNCLVLGSTR